MYQVFVVRVTVDDDGDQKSWRYGVNEISDLDAKAALGRFLSDRGIVYTNMEIIPATPGEVASLNLAAGCVGLLN